MRTSIVRVVLGLLVVLLAYGPAQLTLAQVGTSKKTVNVELIVDASGSMAAATDTGVLRIDAAKQVLAQVISAIPDVEGVNVGLRVYGHKGDNTEAGRAESCLSSDLLVPMSGVDATQLTAQANALQPVGWTPLGFSLQEAAKDFKEPASDNVVNAIVMVTDGLETCDADPVAIAGKLHKSPVGITTHVIGFGTTAEEQATLNGIAKAGGGQLLGSNNAGQLMDALFSILEKLDVVAETGTGETRDSPLGVGRIGKVGDYEISVLSVTPNANEVGPTKNSIAPPAGEGNQYFMARVALTYRGVGSGVPKNDLRFQAVGELGKGYRDSFECAAGMEDSVDGIVDVFEDGSAEGDLCWEISTKDENSLEMYVKFGSSPGAQTVWFSLGNPIAIKSDSLATTVPSGVTESTETPIAETFITLVATDIKFSRTEIRVPANTEFTIKLTNEGVLQHAFAIDSLGIKTAPLNNGDYSTISSALPPGTYDFYCPIPGHKEAGMVGTLIVE